MLLTTSKHASQELQALTRRICAHWPECRYLPRSERPLERLQTLASRAGEETIVVISSPQTERPSKSKKKKAGALPVAVLSSRARFSAGVWGWHEKTISISKIKFGPPMPRLSPEDDPLELKISPGQPSLLLGAFLGLVGGKRSPIFEDSTLITLKATAKKAEIKISKTSLIQFEYSWC